MKKTTIINGQPCEPFDYDKYKAGRKVVTKDGKWRATGDHLKARSTIYVKLVSDAGEEMVISYRMKYNKLLDDYDYDYDLFLLPDIREMWVAVDTLYDKYYIYANEKELDDVVLMAQLANSDNEKYLKKAKLIIYG